MRTRLPFAVSKRFRRLVSFYLPEASCSLGVSLAVTLSLAASAGSSNQVCGDEPLADQTQIAFAEEETSEDKSSGPVTVLLDQRFSQAEGRAGLCDVYQPTQEPPPGGRPAVIVIHGGGWVLGDKWSLEGYSRMLAETGIVAININYRLAPRHKFPAQVDDVRDALVWTAKNAERFAINLNRLGLCGYSAGGHLSALVAVLADEPFAVQVAASNWPPHDERWQQLPTVRAVCAGSPPCDFRSLPMDNTSVAFFLGGSRREKPQAYRVASPTAHVSRTDPATQLIHGESDLLVPIEGTEQMHKAMCDAGVDCRFEVMPKQGHLLTFLNPQTPRTMIAFFQEMLLESR